MNTKYFMNYNYNCIILTSYHVPRLRYRAYDPKKLILHLHLTKSLKRDNVYKLCLRLLQDIICLVLTP